MSQPIDQVGSTPAGALYDIGYRRYPGPRLSRQAIGRALFLDTLRGAFGLGRANRAKIAPFLLLAAATVPALVIAVLVNVTGFDAVTPWTYVQGAGILAVLFVAGQAPAAVSRDLRFRTISLYFSRPLSREGYVRAKYAGLAAAVAIFTTIPVLLLYAGAMLAGLPWRQQTGQLLLALLGNVLLATLLAGIALLVAAVTPRRGLGVAAVFAVLLTMGAVEGILEALAVQQNRPGLSLYAGLADPFTLVDRVLGWISRQPTGLMQVVVGAGSGVVFALVAVVVAAGCYALLVLRYRKVAVS